MLKHDFKRYFCVHCGRSFDVPVRCGDRFCNVCARASRIRARHRLDHIILTTKRADGHQWRFCTLTIPNQQDLAEAVNLIVRCFRRMRTAPCWTDHVTAGVYVIEVTHGLDGWHVHIHAMILGTYFPQRTLVALWSKYSPGRIVDIRKCFGRTAVGYLTHYLTAGDLPDADRLSVSDALHGRRMFSAFGDAHTANQTFKKPHFVCPGCGCDEVRWQGAICHESFDQSWSAGDDPQRTVIATASATNDDQRPSSAQLYLASLSQS